MLSRLFKSVVGSALLENKQGDQSGEWKTLITLAAVQP